MTLLDKLVRHLGKPRNDKLLHFSQHLQHDRHTAIYARHGYPLRNESWGRLFPLIQGTGVHETIHAAMGEIYPKYVPEHEISIQAGRFGLTEHWIGTADAYVEDDAGKVWLLDYKTISGVGYDYLNNEVKPEHKWQVSAYYHLGPTQECTPAIIYFPTSPHYTKKWAEPILIEFEPYTREEVLARMIEVEAHIQNYIQHDELPPIPEGSYQWVDKKRNTTGDFLLVERPNYTRFFCPWGGLDDDPCGCYTDEKKKTIAEWDHKDGLTIMDGYDKIVEKIGGPYETLVQTED